MKRLLFACSVVFAFGAMCTGAPTTDADETDGEADKDKEVVVVPVPDDGEDGEHWCCEYADDDGGKKFALVDGPSECNDKFADQDGRWVSGSQCTPCCCKSPNDPDDDDKGSTFELTTPAACSDVGECVAADGQEECEAKDDDDEGRDNEEDKGNEDRPVRKGPPVKPGSSGGAVRRPGTGDGGGGGGGGTGKDKGKGKGK